MCAQFLQCFVGVCSWMGTRLMFSVAWYNLCYILTGLESGSGCLQIIRGRNGCSTARKKNSESASQNYPSNCSEG